MTKHTQTAALEPSPSPNAEGDVSLRDVLGFQLVAASLVTNAMFEEAAGKPLGMSRVDYAVLMLIRESPGLSGSSLAQTLAVTPPYIAGRLASLQSRGLITRSASKVDRRAQVLKLTAAGMRLCETATSRLVIAERAISQRLSPGETLMLREMLLKIASM
ncbi:MarR family winged helix-turn-helix transcriptional regulator [Variovorax sp. HJSM1_2]|uniref:MarR family winged helix-turn-helix transcriptional regulator n=1 Tax=Variovorax sp. HJSM1_2 TaxID=3366263 RepID=UPI003BC3E6DD